MHRLCLLVAVAILATKHGIVLASEDSVGEDVETDRLSPLDSGSFEDESDMMMKRNLGQDQVKKSETVLRFGKRSRSASDSLLRFGRLSPSPPRVEPMRFGRSGNENSKIPTLLRFGRARTADTTLRFGRARPMDTTLRFG